MSIEVDFFHYRCLVDEKEDPKHLVSPHHSGKAAQNFTFDKVSPKFRFVDDGTITLSENQIFLKNIALSESVYVNPLKDFEAYEKWKKGQVRFPFYGKHRPLGIEKQETKTASTQIKGTIGEVIAGIFFEGYLNGRIIVRPIYKYPDFIGWLPSKGFGYCESKCNDSKTVNSQLDKNILNGRVPKDLLKSLIAETIAELTFRPELTIFLSFSLIDSYKPAKIKHTVLELYTKKRSPSSAASSTAPSPLIDELLDDAFQETIEDLSKELKEDKDLAKALAKEYKWRIEAGLRDKISEIEEHTGLKGKLSGTADLEEGIDRILGKEESQKIINAAIKGKDIYGLKHNKKQIGINLHSKKIKKMTMEYLDEYDNKSNIFIQHLDIQSILSLDNTSGEIRCLEDKENEFYVCGDALIGIVDKKITKPKTIKLNDKRWKDLTLL